MKPIEDVEFLKFKGWKLVNGYKIDVEQITDMDEYSHIFFKDLHDYVEDVEYWENEDIDNVYDDIDDLIETEYPEYIDAEGNLYDEPVQELKSHFLKDGENK